MGFILSTFYFVCVYAYQSTSSLQSLMQLHLLVQITQGQEDNPEELITLAAAHASPCIHFIETEPSVLRDVPWIRLREHRVYIRKSTLTHVGFSQNTYN